MLKKNTIARVYEHYFDTLAYRETVTRAMREFFDLPDFPRSGIPRGTESTPGFYNEWFFYDFAFDAKGSALAHFVRTNPLALPDAELRVYRDLLDNRFGLFRVDEVEPLKGAQLTLLPDGGAFEVQEFSATMDMQIGWGAFARVARVGAHYELVGADSFAVPLEDPEFAPYLEQLLAKERLTPKDVHLMLMTGEVPG